MDVSRDVFANDAEPFTTQRAAIDRVTQDREDVRVDMPTPACRGHELDLSNTSSDWCPDAPSTKLTKPANELLVTAFDAVCVRGHRHERQPRTCWQLSKTFFNVAAAALRAPCLTPRTHR